MVLNSDTFFNFYKPRILRTIQMKFGEHLDWNFFWPVICLLLHLKLRFFFLQSSRVKLAKRANSTPSVENKGRLKCSFLPERWNLWGDSRQATNLMKQIRSKEPVVAFVAQVRKPLIKHEGRQAAAGTTQAAQQSSRLGAGPARLGAARTGPHQEALVGHLN